MFLIDPDSGLLDALRRLAVLTEPQLEHIANQLTVTGRVNRLLADVVAASSDKQLADFMTALVKTGQKHVAAFIRASGRRTAKHGDDCWPVLAAGDRIRALDANLERIVDLIDSRCGLLEELRRSACSSTTSHRRCLDQIDSAGATDVERQRRLVWFLYRRSVADYDQFVECLLRTKQYAVASLLAPDVLHRTDKKRPLTDDQRSRLAANREALVESIDPSGRLLDKLVAADCITRRQKEFVESTAAARFERNARLVRIVGGGSGSDFDKFVECLAKTGQRAACRILLSTGGADAPAGTRRDVHGKKGCCRRVVPVVA